VKDNAEKKKKRVKLKTLQQDQNFWRRD